MNKLRLFIFSIVAALGFSTVAHGAIDSVSVLQNVRNKSEATYYVKNDHDYKSKVVYMELQKYGSGFKKHSSRKLNVDSDEQVKESFKKLESGKYRLKYTVSGKDAYTSVFTIK